MGIKKAQNNIVVVPTSALGFIRQFTRKDGTTFEITRILGRTVLKDDDGADIRVRVQLDVDLADDGLAPAILGLTASRAECEAAGIVTTRWEGVVGAVLLPRDTSFHLAIASAKVYTGRNGMGVGLYASVEDIDRVATVAPKVTGERASAEALRQAAVPYNREAPSSQESGADVPAYGHLGETPEAEPF